MDEHGNLDGPIGSPTSRLVVLRGNSGSGKSTVAAGLRAERPERSLAVVGQDLVRRDLLGVYDDRDGHATQLIDLTTRYALTRGFDVVLEGILNPAWYGDTLLRLVADHRGVSRCYLYDLPFEETVHRHAGKPVAEAFGVDELREWWRGFQPVDGLGEHVITADEDLDSTVARILDECWG